MLHWLQWAALALVGLMAAVQPVGADDLWWQLSRGRAVWEGALTPSASLLTLEQRAEADWLGGLAAYGLYQVLQSHGWMLWRGAVVACVLIAAVGSVTAVGGGSRHRLLSPPALLLVTVTLLALADDLDPLPRLFDCLGIAFTAWWCWPAPRRSTVGQAVPEPGFRGRRLVLLAAIFWCWANTGPAVAAGAALLLLAAIGSTAGSAKGAPARWGELAVALAFGSLNPRGVFAWSDSIVSLVPSLVTPPAILDGTRWEVLHTDAWGFREWTFLGLTAVWIVSRVALRRQRLGARAASEDGAQGADGEGGAGEGEKVPARPPTGSLVIVTELLPFLWMQWLAWSSVQNVSIAATWLAVDLAAQWRAAGWWFWGQERGASDRRVASAAVAGDDGGTLPKTIAGAERGEASGSQRHSLPGEVGLQGGLGFRGGYGMALLLLGGAVYLSGTASSMGWGIDASLDHRLLKLALQETRPYGTALADDVRSAGMLAWLLPQLPPPPSFAAQEPRRLQDIPLRAVTAGRFLPHQQLLDDLRRGRLMRYWRDDGTPGGYWLELRSRQTTLICVSDHHVGLIAGLEPSIWKPLSLDAPVLPYAPAGDEAYIERLIEVLRYRDTVEYADWDYQLPMSSGSPFDRDWFGLRPSVAGPEQVARQAAVFRAMDLHYAALRVLLGERQVYPGDAGLAAEVVRCQIELADQELVTAGKPSWFRFWASRYDVGAGKLPPFRPVPSRGRDWDGPEQGEPLTVRDEAAVSRLKPRLEAYLRVGPVALLEDMSAEEHPQLIYAALCGAIEAGEHDRADRLIAAFRAGPADGTLQALVDMRQRELHPGGVDELEQR